MKVGLLADLHGNATALKSVLAAARSNSVECLLVAGDLVGYYYEPNSVLEMLGGWKWFSVRGNHEEMLLSWMLGNGRKQIVERYGSGLEFACSLLNTSELELLTGLPIVRRIELGNKSVLLCHGTPASVDTYVYPDAETHCVDELFQQGVDLCVSGHTHYPQLWQRCGKLVVNPGSVGQPRDGTPGACWALWDTLSGDVTLHRETYDTSCLERQCREQDPHLPYLAEVLVRRRNT